MVSCFKNPHLLWFTERKKAETNSKLHLWRRELYYCRLFLLTLDVRITAIISRTSFVFLIYVHDKQEADLYHNNYVYLIHVCIFVFAGVVQV